MGIANVISAISMFGKVLNLASSVLCLAEQLYNFYMRFKQER